MNTLLLRLFLLMVFRMGTQNCTSKFHNLGSLISIFKRVTFTSLWLNSLIFYIKICLLNESQNFNPFHVRLFSISNGLQNGNPKLHFQIP